MEPGTWSLDKTVFCLHPLGLGVWTKQCSVSTLWDLEFGQNSVHPLGLGVWTKQCSFSTLWDLAFMQVINVNSVLSPPSGTWGLDKTVFYLHTVSTVFSLHPLRLGLYTGHQCQQCSVSTLSELAFIQIISVNSVLSPPSGTWLLYRSSVSTVFSLHPLRLGFYTDHQCQQCSLSTLWDLAFIQIISVISVLSPPSLTWLLYRSSVSTVFSLHPLRLGFYTDHQCHQCSLSTLWDWAFVQIISVNSVLSPPSPNWLLYRLSVSEKPASTAHMHARARARVRVCVRVCVILVVYITHKKAVSQI